MAPPREQTLTIAEARLSMPDEYKGMQRWDAPEVAEIVDKLQKGDPALGWEGDPRLVLYTDGEVWMLYRLEHDGSLKGILRSRPDTHLDHRLILKLMERDIRRGFDITKFVESQVIR